jgi:hypothetical protein
MSNIIINPFKISLIIEIINIDSTLQIVNTETSKVLRKSKMAAKEWSSVHTERIAR